MLLDSMPVLFFSLLLLLLLIWFGVSASQWNAFSHIYADDLLSLLFFWFASFFTLHNIVTQVLGSIEAEIEGKRENDRKWILFGKNVCMRFFSAHEYWMRCQIFPFSCWLLFDYINIKVRMIATFLRSPNPIYSLI